MPTAFAWIEILKKHFLRDGIITLPILSMKVRENRRVSQDCTIVNCQTSKQP